MDTLFPLDWPDHVRAFLAPFRINCASPTEEEHRGDWGCYSLQTLHVTETAYNGAWGMFRLGRSTLHYLASPAYGGEEGQGVIWAIQSDFAEPLHFWAAAITLQLFSDTGFNEAWFDFRIEPTSRIIESPPAPTMKRRLVVEGWPQGKLAIPPALDEELLSGWQLNDEWNDQCCLYRTPSLYCLWNWLTGA